MKYTDNAKNLFRMYKNLGDKAIAQLENNHLNWSANEDTNSIATIVKHMWGNMLSRWIDFKTTDGEKPWRKRDAEFEQTELSRSQILEMWEEGWACLFHALDTITDEELEQIIYIRNEGHTILEAVNRQIGHYAYHVGQIVYIAKMCKSTSWDSLSIPRNKSSEYNADKFAQDKELRHFTENL
jgi:hypothetical protein